MKTLFLLFLFVLPSCFAIAYEEININVYGNTNYSSSTSKSLNTNLYVDYKVPLYETDNKVWGLFVAGKVNPAYDHLGNEIKMDVFTVLGIDF